MPTHPEAPPGALAPPVPWDPGLWLRYTRWAIRVLGGLWILYALSGVCMLVWALMNPDYPMIGVLLMTGASMAAASGGFGALHLLIAWRLGKGSRLAWVLGILLGIFYVPTGCLPLGVGILAVLLNAKVRKGFLG